MPVKQSPLCERHLNDWMAQSARPLQPCLVGHDECARDSMGVAQGDYVRWRCCDFIGQVLRLAEQLPAADYAINLCDNRYVFTLAFCAAIVKGQTTLLPQRLFF